MWANGRKPGAMLLIKAVRAVPPDRGFCVVIAVGTVIDKEQIDITILVEVTGPRCRGGMCKETLSVGQRETSVIVPIEITVDVPFLFIKVRRANTEVQSVCPLDAQPATGRLDLMVRISHSIEKSSHPDGM